MTDPTREDIMLLARLAGLDLSPAHFDELADAYGHVRELLARVAVARPRADEPAHVFSPQALVTGSA